MACLIQILVLWIWILVSVSGDTEKTALVNKDGLVVTTEDDVHAVTSYWKLVVTLEEPPHPTDVLEYATNLLTVIKNVNITGTFKSSWLSRIHQVRYRLTSLPDSRTRMSTYVKTDSRVKRGLFDFVGHISHALFGTATEEEVQETRLMIEKMHSNNDAVTHVVQDLVTIVNKTQENTIVNRVRLNELTKRQIAMTAFLNRLTTSTYWTTVAVEHLKVKVEIDRMLEDLEMMTDAYCDAYSVYQFQRGSLEWGRLSEDILPFAQLQEILDKGKEQNMINVSPIEWYYRYCEVEPLWFSDRTLVYRVSIPFIERKQYLLYSINSFAIPLNGSNTAQLMVHGSYGYDTITGDMFTLEKCVGKAPMVCDASVVYNNKGMKCERGIVSGDVEHRLVCPVEITIAKKEPMVKNVGLNNYILLTWGEMVTRHCKGMPESKFLLTRGVHHVFVNASCTLAGETWKLVGIQTHLQDVNVSMWRHNVIEPFHLEEIVTNKLAQFQEDYPLALLPEIHSVSIGELRAGHLRSLQWKSGNDAGMMPWMNLAGVILIVCVLLTMTRRMLFACLQRCILCAKCNWWKSTNDVEPQMDEMRVPCGEDLITPPAQLAEYSIPLSVVTQLVEHQRIRNHTDSDS